MNSKRALRAEETIIVINDNWVTSFDLLKLRWTLWLFVIRYLGRKTSMVIIKILIWQLLNKIIIIIVNYYWSEYLKQFLYRSHILLQMLKVWLKAINFKIPIIGFILLFRFVIELQFFYQLMKFKKKQGPMDFQKQEEELESFLLGEQLKHHI